MPTPTREALIIDDRYNGGGFIPDRMIELLARKPLNYWKRRGLDPQATPMLSHNGPKAMLINEAVRKLRRRYPAVLLPQAGPRQADRQRNSHWFSIKA